MPPRHVIHPEATPTTELITRLLALADELDRTDGFSARETAPVRKAAERLAELDFAVNETWQD